jgi:hypothetical protein
MIGLSLGHDRIGRAASCANAAGAATQRMASTGKRKSKSPGSI